VTGVSETTSSSSLPWWREPTRAQWISFTAAWAGWVMDAFDFTVFLLVMPEIAKEFGMSMTATAGSITLTMLFRLAGGTLAGAAADRWGRKLPLMISIIGFALCDGAVALAPSFGWVLALRTLFGLFMGAEWTSGATLAMENWPERSRGIASGILQGSWAIGHALAGLATALVVPTYGWRALFVLAALPALLVLPIRAWVPESHDWEKAKGQTASKGAGSGWGEVGSRPVVLRLVWGSLALAFGFGMYYGLSSLQAPLVKTQLGLTTGDLTLFVTCFNAGMLVGAVAWGALASRKSPGLALLIPSLLLLPSLPLYAGEVPGFLWLGAALGGAFGAGISGVTPLLLTSLFPPHIRARCVGIVYHAGAFPAAFVPMGTSALATEAALGSYGRSMGVVAGASAVLLMFMLLFRPRPYVPAAGAVVPADAAGAATAMH
jgi:SHS family lactate transporter-like MFS transporter